MAAGTLAGTELGQGMEITFDGAGVTRLIQNLLWMASQDGAPAPERAGLIQSLASRLGLDMAGVAELSKAPGFWKPSSRSEAEATPTCPVKDAGVPWSGGENQRHGSAEVR